MDLQEEDVVLVTQEAPVMELYINRPKALNALNADVLQSLILRIGTALQSSVVKVLIISGRGDDAFAAGADVASMNELGPRAIADYVELGQRAMRVIETCPLPVIAAVKGYALGGGLELALACDMIVAAETAKVGQPEVNLGIIPGFGGTQRLIQRCGIGTARRLILTGEIIQAPEALSLGVVDKLAPADTVLTEARRFAKMMVDKGPLAVASAKRVLRETIEPQMLGGLQREVEEFLKLFGTADREEGMRAFLQKRKPAFTGR